MVVLSAPVTLITLTPKDVGCKVWWESVEQDKMQDEIA